jgi:hypothetical protein
VGVSGDFLALKGHLGQKTALIALKAWMDISIESMDSIDFACILLK